jgi:HK97 family phage major capsid protein
MNRIEEINARLAEIRADMERRADALTEAEIAAYETEVQNLTTERAGLMASVERRRNLLNQIAQGVEGTVVRTFRNADGGESRAAANPVESPEYRRAWLKNLAVRDGVPLFGEMTAEERAAFTTTTANTAAVVPPVTLNMIIDLVESLCPMLDDAQVTGMTQGFGVPRRKGINAGDAKGVAEGTANDDEENEFDLLSLEGIEIKKHVVITRKMKFKSIDAFESWLVNELAERVAVAKNRVIRNRLDGVAPAGGSAVANAGIAAANILTNQTYGDAAIRGMFALLKGNGERVVYANNKTIWNYLAGIEDGNHVKLFVPNSMVDPIVAGRIYGASVKVDNEIADNVVYLGVKGAVMANDYDDLTIFNAIEPKTANEIKTAYSLFDAGLKNPESFVKATFKTT